MRSSFSGGRFTTKGIDLLSNISTEYYLYSTLLQCPLNTMYSKLTT